MGPPGFDSSADRNAFRNSTAIPTFAKGWFDDLTSADVEDAFRGGDAPDCVRGSNNDDEISGRGGADRLVGRYGDDFLSGGAGPDTLEGGADDDSLYSGRDADHLLGQSEDGCLSGGIDAMPTCSRTRATPSTSSRRAPRWRRNPTRQSEIILLGLSSVGFSSRIYPLNFNNLRAHEARYETLYEEMLHAVGREHTV